MKAMTSNVKELKKLVLALSKRYNEVEMKFDVNGIKIQEIDKTMVEVINLEIEAGFFEEFSVDGEEKICIQTKELYDLLKGFDKKSVLEMETRENNLAIIEKGTIVSETIMKGVERTEEDMPPVNELHFDTSFAIDGLDKVIKKAGSLDETIAFDFLNGKVIASCNNTEIGLEEVIENLKGNGKSKYPIEYMKTFLKLTDKIEMKMGTDYPAELTFRMNYITLKQIIAPRVESD